MRENINILKRKWRNGDIIGCFDFCKTLINDDIDESSTWGEGSAVVGDFLKAVNLKQGKVMKLDMCEPMLELLVTIVVPEIFDGEEGVMSNIMRESGTLSIRRIP